MRSSRIAAAVAVAAALMLAAPAVALADADLSVAISDSPDPVLAGANLTYSITVANAGTDPATSAQVDMTLPPDTTFVTLSSSGPWSCTTPAVGAGGSVTCTSASLSVSSDTFSLVVAVGPAVATGTLITGTVTIGSADVDPDPGDNSATATTTVAEEADLVVGMTAAPEPATVGEDVTYAITVDNDGPSSAAGTGLAVPIPGGMSFQSLTAAGGWTCTTPAVGATSGTVSCTIASMPVGSRAFTVVLRPTPDAAGQTIGVNATATSASIDPSPVDASLTVQTNVSPLPAPPPPPAFRRPTVTGLTPADGAPGSFVAIAGDGFAGATGVRFGGVPALFVVEGHGRISAVVPEGTPGSTVDVVVTGPGGTSPGGAGARFTYAAAVTPPPLTPPPSDPDSSRVVCASVPDLAGKRVSGAKRALRKAGCRAAPLQVRGRLRRDGRPNRIASQTPKAGAELREGEAIVATMRGRRAG